MKKSPNIYFADELKNWNDQAAVKGEDGITRWTAARPLGYPGLSIFTRFKTAWKVFLGEWDALRWYDQ